MKEDILSEITRFEAKIDRRYRKKLPFYYFNKFQKYSRFHFTKMTWDYFNYGYGKIKDNMHLFADADAFHKTLWDAIDNAKVFCLNEIFNKN